MPDSESSSSSEEESEPLDSSPSSSSNSSSSNRDSDSKSESEDSNLDLTNKSSEDTKPWKTLAEAKKANIKTQAKRAKAAKRLIKPILPNEYDGSANAEKYHCFVLEGLQYCKEGHVPEDERVFLLSHYLTGKAHSFFTQKVSKNHEQWKLKDFFEELFNFCFPMNYCSLQRKKKLSVVTRMIVCKHKHVIKLWDGFNPKMRYELHRTRLNKEVHTWEKIVHKAELIEMADLENELGKPGGHKDFAPKVQLSDEKKAQYDAQELYYGCGEKGHSSRNCPQKNTVQSNKKGPPGLQAHAMSYLTRDNECDSDNEDSELGPESDPEGEDQVPKSESESNQASGSDDAGIPMFTINEDGEPICTFAIIAKQVFGYPDTPWSDFFLHKMLEPGGWWPRSIDDWISIAARFVLNHDGPCPGDETWWGAETSYRFHVYRLDENTYAISDLESAYGELTIATEKLLDPTFKLSAWYAEQRAW
ncbi:hypothetical protein EV368DRAFT_65609 [Lentinula lateritia]|nr:hypothetical protein EV368DRAFT_65609 [Lentinula lateritia]